MSDRTFCKRCVQSERQQQGMVQDPVARQAGATVTISGDITVTKPGDRREREKSKWSRVCHCVEGEGTDCQELCALGGGCPHPANREKLGDLLFSDPC